jgi:nitroreductase
MAGALGAAALAGDGVWYGFGEREASSGSVTPYSAWSDWSDGNATPENIPLTLVRAAVLAASPHNTQPWRFRVGESFVEVYLETSRSVRGLDPYLREAHIGIGCALENLLLAAAAHGCAAKLIPAAGELSAGPERPALQLAGRVELSASAKHQSELYQAIPLRRTNRSPYDPARSLPSGFAGDLISACRADEDVRLFLFEDSTQRAELTRISAAANLELYSDPAVESGSEAWIRWRSSEVQRFKDGLTIDCFGLSPAMTALAKLAPVSVLKRAAAPEHRSQLYARQMQSASLIGVIALRDRLSIRQNLSAGRVWQRAHLLATARGIGARPCNEAIERIDHERLLGRAPQTHQTQSELSRVIGDPAWQPTFLFLMGYPTQAAHASPRRPAELTVAASAEGTQTIPQSRT